MEAILNLRLKEGRDARNHPLIKGRKMIGKGWYAAAFEGKAANAIYKLTLDASHHAVAADPVLKVESRYMPTVFDHHGVVGEQQLRPIYLMEVERLTPVMKSEHKAARSLAHKIVNYSNRELFDLRDVKRNDYQGTESLVLKRLAQQDFLPEGMGEAFEKLSEVILNEDFCLDLKLTNMMVREEDGTLVLNDVICDGWHLASRRLAMLKAARKKRLHAA